MNGTNYEVPHCGVFSTPHSHPSWFQIFASGSCFQIPFLHYSENKLRNNNNILDRVDSAVQVVNYKTGALSIRETRVFQIRLAIAYCSCKSIRLAISFNPLC